MFSNYRVLFPVDFSDRCREAAPYFADLVKRLRGRLHLLHVVEDGTCADEVFAQRAIDLAAFAARMPGGLYCPQTVAWGNPSSVIYDYVNAQNIDVVAVPTRGYGILRRWALGSVALNVLRKAPCTVWTEASNGKPHTRWSPVLCAVDLEHGSEEVVNYASALAEQFHAGLIVIHVVPPIEQGTLWVPSHLPAALSEERAQQALGELFKKLRIAPRYIIRTGLLEDAIASAVERTGSQLLVVGRGGRTRVSGSLGTNTYGLIRNSRCPVVSCPRPAASPACFWNEWQQEAAQPAEYQPFELPLGVRR